MGRSSYKRTGSDYQRSYKRSKWRPQPQQAPYEGRSGGGFSMGKGILRTFIIIATLMIAGAILYDPIVTIVSTIGGAHPDPTTGNWITGLSLAFATSIAFGIVMALAWLFFWGQKFEHEKF